MKGFDTKALILFPYSENIESKPVSYKYRFKQSLQNMIDYLHSQNIEAHAMLTDDIANTYKAMFDKWVSPLSKADRFFVSKHCEGLDDAMKINAIEYPEVYNECARKDSGTPDMSIAARFELVTKHAKQACACIIPQYNIVVHFMVKTKLQYKVTTKPGDKRIRINVDAANFIPTVYMSGAEVPAIDVLGVPYANRNLSAWEVNNEK